MMYSEGSVDPQVAIGGFTFLIKPPASERFNPSLPADYARFISAGRPDITLAIADKSRGKSNLPGDPVFDAGPNWRMHRKEGEYIIRTMFQEARCSADFLRADICSGSESKGFSNLTEALAYPLPEIIMIHLLASNKGLLTHACGISDGSGVYLFCGMSGAGKSTLANLWQEQPNVSVLSDDRIIVRRIAGVWKAFGTPWHGEAGHCSAVSAPIKKIFFIEHASENRIKKINTGNAVSMLLARSFPPFWNMDLMKNTLGYMDSLLQSVPYLLLGVKPDADIIDFVKLI